MQIPFYHVRFTKTIIRPVINQNTPTSNKNDNIATCASLAIDCKNSLITTNFSLWLWYLMSGRNTTNTVKILHWLTQNRRVFRLRKRLCCQHYDCIKLRPPFFCVYGYDTTDLGEFIFVRLAVKNLDCDIYGRTLLHLRI